MGEIIYNGRSSRSIGLEVETFPAYEMPKRSYEKVHVPGRNGDLIFDNGSWENAKRTYIVAIGSYEIPYYEFANKLSEWLHSTSTYARLEDSYEPDYYRLAAFLEESSLTNIYNHGGEMSLEFDCKPQRFLKIGDDPVVVTKSGTKLQNPTQFESLPIIHVFGSGSGTITVGTTSITISSIGTEIVLDSEIQDAYLGTANRNSAITAKNGFPSLDVGTTTITFNGGISRVEVIPKWFTL